MKQNKESSQKKQVQLKGIPAAPGIVIGKVHIFGTEDIMPVERAILESQIPSEITRLKDAMEQTQKEILEIERKISKEMGVEHGRIFSAHLLVLEDSVLVQEVIARLKKRKKNIEIIFSEVLDKYINVLADY